MLVLLHGTFSTPAAPSRKLWTQHPRARAQAVRRTTATRVYALDHPTLGASPIDNALTLAQALPHGARLHLLTHSRGGLVAEVLARVCADAASDLALPADVLEAVPADADYTQHRDALHALVAQSQASGASGSSAWCASPARRAARCWRRSGSTPTCRCFKWTLELAGVPVLPELVDFLGEVAQRRTDPARAARARGADAGQPAGAVAERRATSRSPAQLRVVAGDIEGDSVVSWLKTLLADAFYWTDNDLVVQTRSMYGGAPRARQAPASCSTTAARSRTSTTSPTSAPSNAVADGLTRGQPAGFRAIGPLSWAGEDASGTRGATAARVARPEQ